MKVPQTTTKAVESYLSSKSPIESTLQHVFLQLEDALLQPECLRSLFPFLISRNVLIILKHSY